MTVRHRLIPTRVEDLRRRRFLRHRKTHGCKLSSQSDAGMTWPKTRIVWCLLSRPMRKLHTSAYSVSEKGVFQNQKLISPRITVQVHPPFQGISHPNTAYGCCLHRWIRPGVSGIRIQERASSYIQKHCGKWFSCRSEKLYALIHKSQQCVHYHRRTAIIPRNCRKLLPRPRDRRDKDDHGRLFAPGLYPARTDVPTRCTDWSHHSKG